MTTDSGHRETTLVTALTIAARSQGRPVVVKQRRPVDDWLVPELEAAAAAEARRTTEAEASWLAAARHDGVARLRRVACHEARLETDAAGVHSLRTVALTGLLTMTDAARALEAVALVLGGLHRRRLTHANLAPEHLVVAGRHRVDRPVLCSPGPLPPGVDHDPDVDLAGLTDVARTLGPDLVTGHRGWAEVIDSLGTAADAGTAARVLGEAARRRPWLAPRRLAARRRRPR